MDIERKGNVTIVGSQRQNANRVAAFFQEMGSHLDACELKEGAFVAHTLPTYQLPSLIPEDRLQPLEIGKP